MIYFPGQFEHFANRLSGGRNRDRSTLTQPQIKVVQISSDRKTKSRLYVQLDERKRLVSFLSRFEQVSNPTPGSSPASTTTKLSPQINVFYTGSNRQTNGRSYVQLDETKRSGYFPGRFEHFRAPSAGIVRPDSTTNVKTPVILNKSFRGMLKSANGRQIICPARRDEAFGATFDPI